MPTGGSLSGLNPTGSEMRRLILVVLFACAAIPGCQCSDKPDIGPVEGGAAATATVDTGNLA